MPSSTFCDYERYRAAVALNNMGVTLMERGCFKQSMSTIKDAVQAMKGVFRPCPKPANTDLDGMIKRARRRFTKPQLQTRPLVMDTVSYDDSLVPLLGLRDRLSVNRCRPTRIELSDDAESMEGRDPDLETVVVLCNFGLSYYVVAESEPGQENYQKLLDNAQSIFDLASTVITNRFAACEDLMEEARLMTVALLLTGNMAHVFSKTGRLSEAESYCEKYRRIGEAIQACEVTDWFSPERTIAAAAA